MAAVFPDLAACPENLTEEIRIPDHPLVKETIENCLREAMDIDSLSRCLRICAMAGLSAWPSIPRSLRLFRMRF